MSRDFYRNRCKLGSIPQADVLAPVYNIFEDFEDANLNFAFTVSGTGTWDRSTVAAHSGTYCYRGATNTISTIYSEFTIPKTGTLSLYYRISSESISYDWGKIYVNGVQKVIVGGADTGWVLWSTPVVAGDVIKFEYRKDGSGDSGFDAFLIDDILLEVATGGG